MRAKLNVLSAALMVQLRRAAEELVADRDVRAIVLTGAGNGFSTGGDLRMMKRATEHLADPAGEGGTFEIWRWIREQFGGMARTIAVSGAKAATSCWAPFGLGRPPQSGSSSTTPAMATAFETSARRPASSVRPDDATATRLPRTTRRFTATSR